MNSVNDTLELSVTETRGPLAVVSLTGVLDFDTVPAFHEQTAEAAAGHPRLVLDLSGVTFCDSSGLNALLRLQRLVDGLEGRLVLAAPPAQLGRILSITGMDTVFPVHGSVAEALAAHATDDHEPAP